MINVNGTLFFSGHDSAGNVEIWRSNGTFAGTTLVKNLLPGPENWAFQDFANVNGTLFFGGKDQSHGAELWTSNGNTAGTAMVKDINPGLGGSYPHSITNVNGVAFFSANGELWRSNGTATGTQLVKTINPGGNSAAQGLTNSNDTLFFYADDGVHGIEPWKSNGTAAGTTLVKDIRPGIYSSVGPGDQPLVANGTIFFSANNGVSGNELWRSNGTTSGTVLIRDIEPGRLGSSPSYLVDPPTLPHMEISSRDGAASSPVVPAHAGPAAWNPYGSPITEALKPRREDQTLGPAGRHSSDLFFENLANHLWPGLEVT
jgi:ELWxxDGT repeat protein